MGKLYHQLGRQEAVDQLEKIVDGFGRIPDIDPAIDLFDFVKDNVEIPSDLPRKLMDWEEDAIRIIMDIYLNAGRHSDILRVWEILEKRNVKNYKQFCAPECRAVSEILQKEFGEIERISTKTISKEDKGIGSSRYSLSNYAFSQKLKNDVGFVMHYVKKYNRPFISRQ